MTRHRIALLLALGVVGAAAPPAAGKSFVLPVHPYAQFRVGAPVALQAAVASEATGPLPHVHPVVIARRIGTPDVRRFRAPRATDSGGGTTFSVRFPQPGTWRLRVTVPGRRIMYEGESNVLVEPGRDQGAAPPAGDAGGGGGPSALVWILPAIALLTPFAVWALRRRRPAAT